jgi:hypothetical protein
MPSSFRLRAMVDQPSRAQKSVGNPGDGLL